MSRNATAIEIAAPWMAVHDGVLPRPDRYRQWALSLPYRRMKGFKGIARTEDQTLAEIVRRVLPGAVTTLTFFRKSPEGQEEPNFIHSDASMGSWTAILYLHPTPAPGDGTTFWWHLPTGLRGGPMDGSAEPTPGVWEPVSTIPAQFNRLLLFESQAFHSRAIRENYGQGDDARLIQVAFGTRDE